MPKLKLDILGDLQTLCILLASLASKKIRLLEELTIICDQSSDFFACCKWRSHYRFFLAYIQKQQSGVVTDLFHFPYCLDLLHALQKKSVIFASQLLNNNNIEDDEVNDFSVKCNACIDQLVVNQGHFDSIFVQLQSVYSVTEK